MMKITILLFALAIFGCSHAQPKVATPAPTPLPSPAPSEKPTVDSDVKQFAAQQNAGAFSQIEFNKKDWTLSPVAKKKLQKFVSDVGPDTEDLYILVLAWSDEDYPQDEDRRLSPQSVQLANSRNNEIRSFIKSLNRNIPVRVYNMAERPGGWSDLFGTSSAELKDDLEAFGVSGKASKAIIMARVGGSEN